MKGISLVYSRYAIFLLILFTSLPAIKAQIQLLDARTELRAIETPHEGPKPGLYLNVYTGLFVNDFWGTHPLLGLMSSVAINKSQFSFNYEYRYGRSANDYHIKYKDSLRQTGHFRNRAIIYEYSRMILNTGKTELSLIGGLEFNSILIKPSDNELRVSGISYTVGIGYHWLNANNRGPLIQLRYHNMNLSNRMQSDYNKSSVIIRLMHVLSIKSKGRTGVELL